MTSSLPIFSFGGHLFKAKWQEDGLLHISRADLFSNYFLSCPFSCYSGRNLKS